MNSPRRRARELALKAHYQAEMIGCELAEALNQVTQEVVLFPAFENLAREFVKNSTFQEILSGEVEEFIPDFSETISKKCLNESEDCASLCRDVLDKYFKGLTINPDAGTAIKKLVARIGDKLKKEKPLLDFAGQLVKVAAENGKKIDKILEATAQNWSLERMSTIDRCILRSAACEMFYFEEIPINATINEAIELAKQYSADRSYEFVNGILDRIRKEHKLVKNVAAVPEKKSKKENQSEL
ncbi:MAG: transcription antitermination factor NusB [Candidatus Riflebacteria bacterium]